MKPSSEKRLAEDLFLASKSLRQSRALATWNLSSLIKAIASFFFLVMSLVFLTIYFS